MSSTKTTSSGPRSKPAQGASPTPAAARPPSAEGGMEGTIKRAQDGQVNITPAKAVEMAGTLFSQGKYAQAERVCRQIIGARPGNADASNILGVTLNALGQHDEAIATLRNAIKLAPKASTIHANLGEVLRQQGKRDEAEKVLERAVELDPKGAQALNNLGIIQYE